MAHIDYMDFIAKKLISQDYNSKIAPMVAAEIVNVDNQLNPLVEKWLNGESEDYVSQGYSILGLMKSRGMTYPAALLTIDWLIKEPEKAKQSLEKGIK
ncbi:MAG: hypothetical protein HDS11_02260 [Bacteroides sp.]|nr:hypothetical protein [Bacteroides sp.]MBD5377519.1 hypothetical protein [Bacteroides sp.]